MASNLYDTGGPKRVIVVNEPPSTAVADAQRIAADTVDRLFHNLVDYLARRATGPVPEATRETVRDFGNPGRTIDASFEVIPPRRLPPAKKGK